MKCLPSSCCCRGGGWIDAGCKLHGLHAHTGEVVRFNPTIYSRVVPSPPGNRGNPAPIVQGHAQGVVAEMTREGVRRILYHEAWTVLNKHTNAFLSALVRLGRISEETTHLIIEFGSVREVLDEMNREVQPSKVDR